MNREDLTTKNNLGVDCISRLEVLRLLANSIGKTNTYLQTEVLRMPSVTPQEPKTGHWIDDMSLGYHVSICSNCNWRGHGDTCLVYKPKYCPNCGADMREEQTGENT